MDEFSFGSHKSLLFVILLIVSPVSCTAKYTNTQIMFMYVCMHVWVNNSTGRSLLFI